MSKILINQYHFSSSCNQQASILVWPVDFTCDTSHNEACMRKNFNSYLRTRRMWLNDVYYNTCYRTLILEKTICYHVDTYTTSSNNSKMHWNFNAFNSKKSTYNMDVAKISLYSTVSHFWHIVLLLVATWFIAKKHENAKIRSLTATKCPYEFSISSNTSS